MQITSARFFVYASDLSQSLQFYTQVLKLSIVDRVVGGTVLAAGTTELEVLQERRDEEIVLDRRTGFIIFVDDLEAAYAELMQHEITVLTEPATGADGSRAFYIADPDGLPIGIHTTPPPAEPPAEWLFEEQ
jgi:predicted enzyme related to lactoylglutathione lyase